MEQLEKLLSRVEEIDGRLSDLLSKDSLTDDERAEHDLLVEERGKVKEQIGRLQEQMAREEETAKLRQQATEAAKAREKAAQYHIGTNRRTTPDKPQANRHERFDDAGRVTSFFEDTDETINLRFGESRDAVRQQTFRQTLKQNKELLRASGYQPWGVFTSFADFCRDGFERSGHSAFNDRVRQHYAAVEGMSEGTGADGGYTVMPEYSNRILSRMYSNSLWSRTDNYTVTGNNMTFLANAETSRANGSRHGGLRGYWLAEGGTLTSSKPTLREVSLKLKKLGVLVYLTQELIDDGGMALEQYVATKAAEEFQFMLGDSLVNGTGAGQPLGILNAPSLVSVAKESGQLADTIETENVEKMYARFFAGHLMNMEWLHNQDIIPELNTMTLGVGTGGVPTYLPPGGLSSAPYGMLKGRPLTPTEFNSTLGDQGDLIATDLGQILTIGKGGIAQAVSMHVQFLTDQLALRFIIRVDGQPWENSPITPYKGSNTQSSFVTLDAR